MAQLTKYKSIVKQLEDCKHGILLKEIALSDKRFECSAEDLGEARRAVQLALEILYDFRDPEDFLTPWTSKRYYR